MDSSIFLNRTSELESKLEKIIIPEETQREKSIWINIEKG